MSLLLDPCIIMRMVISDIIDKRLLGSQRESYWLIKSSRKFSATISHSLVLRKTRRLRLGLHLFRRKLRLRRKPRQRPKLKPKQRLQRMKKRKLQKRKKTTKKKVRPPGKVSQV